MTIAAGAPSTEQTAMAALSWTYPEDQLIALKAQNEKDKASRG